VTGFSAAGIEVRALLGVFAAAFLAREYVAYRRILPLKYVLTPLLTLIVIAVALLSLAVYPATPYRLLIVAALVFSLVGDVLLMIEEVNLLYQGMVFFFLAHCLYIPAFASYYYPHWSGVFVAAALVVAAAFMMALTWKHSGAKAAPGFAYMGVLAAMVFFAASGFSAGTDARSVMVLAGAILFFASDCLLSVNHFIRKINHSTVFTWLLYAPAQMLFALSCHC